MTSVQNVAGKTKKRDHAREYQRRKDLKSSRAAWPQYVEEHNVEQKVVDGITYWVFYKAVTRDFKSLHAPYRFAGSLQPYKPGNIVKVKEWDTCRKRDCSLGLHVATLAWVRFNYINSTTCPDYRYIEVLVEEQDIVCLPISINGWLLQKIRVKRLRVAREIK